MSAIKDRWCSCTRLRETAEATMNVLELFAEACSTMREAKACDMRCRDGRGRCANSLMHVESITGISREELLRLWFESEAE